MLIRTFTPPIEGIEDIKNIPEHRRFILIYKYPGALIHKTAHTTYGDGCYDLFLINTSTVYGVNYILPKGLVTQFRNSYRGKILEPFKQNGKDINPNASCLFDYCFYSGRLLEGSEFLRYTKPEIVSNQTWENKIVAMLKTTTICPYPQYYNVEDQARMVKTDNPSTLDFDMYTKDATRHQYRLRDLVDKTTVTVSMDIEEDSIFQNQKKFMHAWGPMGDYMPSHTSSDYQSPLQEAMYDLFGGFLDCYTALAKSIFAQAYIIFDIDSGLFSIHKDTLTLKYSYHVEKDEIKREYALLVWTIGEINERFVDRFSIESYSECIIAQIPTRVTFYISPSRCSIRLSGPHLDTTTEKEPRYNQNYRCEYSTSDTEESLLNKELGDGDPLFPSELTEEQVM